MKNKGKVKVLEDKAWARGFISAMRLVKSSGGATRENMRNFFWEAGFHNKKHFLNPFLGDQDEDLKEMEEFISDFMEE